MDRLDISRNDIAARQELTQQALMLSLIRPLAELLNSRLRGKSEQLSECDLISTTMWLFDHMLYYETRSSCPGTTRQEAETILVKHFKESNPDWDDEICVDITQSIFRLLTPKDGFRHTYYDFNDRSYKEHFFRLIDWELREGIGALYKLTTQGIILYSTRLEDNGLEGATISAIRANRTLRRGEISLAIELANSTITNLRRFRLKINAGLRDARTGDTSFTFIDRMKPLLDDSYDLLEEILQQTADTLDRISQEVKDAPLEKRKMLLKAEDSFREIINESQDFKIYISSVQKEFIAYRREIIGMTDLAIVNRDLTESVLKPLLNRPIADLAKFANRFLSLLLPPNLESKSTRKTHYCVDPTSILSTYYNWLEQQYESKAPSIDDDTLRYSDPPPLLDNETIKLANRWVSTYLTKNQKISFQDVISATEQEPMESRFALACLLLIGSRATSDKKTIEVTINGALNHSEWMGDNLGIRIRESI
ncbi:MAG: hypothetical protein HZT40_06950 [Candidatus Thiothrix singaporensis]|uniref:Uncharacterized protein n=1 Tax=Candidatus Thiothrix singaporensis TaxID=2799669 RepID=A0A7L6AQN9_9GAMM|nr:MAG: hypothetical protein HZT40_06950 [Candidatus Thiothrix singaporensis]